MVPRLHRRAIIFTIFVISVAIWCFRTRFIHIDLYGRERVDTTRSYASYSPNTAAGNATDLCSNPPQGHCEFYRDCLEAKFHCGPEGYPIGYGEKYCKKFQAGKDELSSAGQEWMLNTMQCLQRVLVPEEQSAVDQTTPITGGEHNKKCDELKEKAFDSHAPCYIDNGLCKLGVADWARIIEIINFRTLFGSWDAVKETLEAAEGCLEFYAFLLIKC